MQTFIVLGLVPGTNIQTTFNFWMWVIGVLLFMLALPHLLLLAEKIHYAALALGQAWLTERWEVVA